MNPDWPPGARRGEVGVRSGDPRGDGVPGSRTSDFDYDLPTELIASRPAACRDDSRLLVLERATGSLADRRFKDLPRLLSRGDVLVLNDTRVFPARLLGRKPTGAPAEVLLLRPVDGDATGRVWEALVRPGGKLKPGRVVTVADDLTVLIEDSIPGGGRQVRLEGPGDPRALIERHGRVPLPPYIDRESDSADRERYQTVYARHEGSVAAPTAGLHFTRRLLSEVSAAGIGLVRITLHVSLGTFRPVDTARPEEHELPAEPYGVSAEAARSLNAVRRAGGRVCAVGTTTARTLETVSRPDGRYASGAGWTRLFIHPPYRFRGVDMLVTNFHLPRSSLLMLVASLAGVEAVMNAYAHAVRSGYRFYSYGDAMLVR